MDTVEALILDLLEWVDTRERTYDETMAAWRTSCPKLPVWPVWPVWEDATDRELLVTRQVNGRSVVCVTESGRALLAELRSSPRR